MIFYDTNALLELQKAILDTDEIFAISSITLKELENIKVSEHKSPDIKYQARQVLHLLDENSDKYVVIVYKRKFKRILGKLGLPETPDNQIIACAYWLNKKLKNNNVVFITFDISCKMTARLVAGLAASNMQAAKERPYKGFKVVNLSEEELDKFYNSIAKCDNEFELLENEYLIIKYQGTVVDKYVWREGYYQKINYPKFDSKMFGKIMPKDNDIYQICAMDALMHSKLTVLRGPAGSGKSLLSLAYLFQELEKGRIDKIIIFCNTVATADSAKMGFYPGTREEKLLDSQIGNLLQSKLGDRIAVQKMINDGELLLLPMSDIRGFDTSGMNAGVYISEAQNLSKPLMKLALQRIGEDCICILDGDDSAQVDMKAYAGENNGLRKAVDVFKGDREFSTITLQTIKRSHIAEVADKIC